MTDFDPGLGEGGIARLGVRASIPALIFSALRSIFQFLSLTILARLLSPADYGLLAVVTTVIGFVALFRDLGLTTATVQAPVLDHDHLNAAFWLNALVGICLCLLTMASAPVLAVVFREPRLTGAILALSLTFVIGGVGVQYAALLRRKMAFYDLGIAESAGLAAGLLTSVVLAAGGAGYWALIGGPLVQEVVNLAGLMRRCSWRPVGLRPSAKLWDLLHVGGHMLAINVLSYWASNVDRLILGRHFGGIFLGHYTRAQAISFVAGSQLLTPISTVLFPMLSRTVGDPPRFSRLMCMSLRLMAGPAVLACGVMIAAPDWITRVVLGPQWDSAAVLLRPLAVAAATMYLPNNLGWAPVVVGHFRPLLAWVVVTLVAVGVGMNLAGMRWGGVGAVWTLASLLVIMRVPVLFRLVASVSPIRERELWAAQLPFWGAGLFSILMGVAARAWLSPQIHPILGLTVVSAVMLASYLLLLMVWPGAARQLVSDLKAIWRGLRPRAKVAGEQQDPPLDGDTAA